MILFGWMGSVGASPAAQSLSLLFSGSVLALTAGTRQLDSANAYRSVGVVMFLYRGSAAEPAICTVTLIHGRVALTAAHCAMYFNPKPPPWIRTVMSFSPDNPRDPATWIDIDAHLMHPDFPWRNCQLLEPYDFGPCDFVGGGREVPIYRPGVVDVGLMVLSRPVTGIPLAPIAEVGVLDNAVGESMTFVGYGCEAGLGIAHWDGLRNYGSAGLLNVSANTAAYANFPGTGCPGDSGGPTIRNGQVVAVYSSGDATYSYRSRVDTGAVRKWIADVIATVDGVPAVEYYHAAFGHYFMTASADEIDKLDTGVFAGWQRTGETFKVHATADGPRSGLPLFYGRVSANEFPFLRAARARL